MPARYGGWVLSAALLFPAGCATTTSSDEGLVPLTDGKTLLGWHVSSRTGHGTGGRWFVRDGAIHGSQDRPGNGGLLITDRTFGDFYVVLEMKNDWGPCSGLFLRSTEEGKAYQAMVDFRPNGNLMGIYGEGIGGFGVRNYSFGATQDVIQVKEDAAFPCPFSPDRWREVWKPGEWNELAARITGNPPFLETWINGIKVMEYRDTEKRLPDRGGIALQMHGGGDWTQHFVRYRRVRIKELDRP